MGDAGADSGGTGDDSSVTMDVPVGETGAEDAGPDVASEGGEAGPSAACVPSPAAIAAARECRQDDQCPCGAHCELGRCAASCGGEGRSCSAGQQCDRFGYCRPAGDTTSGPPGGGSDVGDLWFERPSVALASDTANATMRVRAVRRATGPYRVTAEAPFQVRCGATGDFGAECAGTDLAAGADLSLALRLMPGATVPAASRRLRFYWGRRVESVSLVAPGARPVVAQTGEYEGTVSLVNATVARVSGPPAMHELGSVAMPVRARLFGSVLQIVDDLSILSADDSMVGSVNTVADAQTVQFPRRTWMTDAAVGDLRGAQTVTYARSPMTFDPLTGSLSFTLTAALNGVTEGATTFSLVWRVELTRTGALAAGAMAPAVPPDAAEPARSAGTRSGWEAAVLRAAAVTGARTEADWEAVLRSASRAALVDGAMAPVGEGRRFDACAETLTVPATAWASLTNARWVPAAYAAPAGGATAAEVAASQRGRQALVALVANAANALAGSRVVSFTPGTVQQLAVPNGVVCAMSFPAQNADTCSPGAETYGAVDRCDEIARELGCVPEAITGAAPAVTFSGALRLQPASGAACTSALELRGTATRVCRMARPSAGHCAELLSCAASVSATGIASANPARVSPPSATSISGDLACSVPAGSASVAIAADARRDDPTATPPTMTDLLAACVSELDRLAAAPPTAGDLLAVTGQTSLTAPRCVDAVRLFAALGLATENDRASAIAPGGSTPDPVSTRFSVRLLQQWLQVYSLLATESAQRMAVPPRLRPAGSSTALPEPRDALDRVLGGLALVQHPRFATAIAAMGADALRAPDYRADWVAELSSQPQHPQTRGLAASMFDASGAALGLLADLLESAALAGSRDLLTYRGRITGRALRSALVTAALAAESDRVARSGAAPARTYLDATDGARRRQQAEFGRALAAARALLADRNPLGVTEADLPLYFFGGARDPGQRFSTVSTYLLGNAASGNSDWATQVMAQLTAAESQLMAAYREEADRTYRARLDTAAQTARVDSLASDYGQRIMNLCGLPAGVTPSGAIEAWERAAGRPFDANTCYVRREDPACNRTFPTGPSREDALFHLCSAGRIRAAGTPVRFAYPPLNVAADALVTGIDDACTAPARCPPGVGSASSSCMTCFGQTFEMSWNLLSAGSVLASEGGTSVEAEQAVAECTRRYPGARRLPPPIENDPAATGSCYRGSIGESALSVRAAAADVAIARSQLGDMLESFEIAGRSCELGNEGAESVQRLRTAMNSTVTALRAAKFATDVIGYLAAATSECGYGIGQTDGLATVGTGGATAAGTLVGCGASFYEAAAQSASAGLQLSIDSVQDWTNDAILTEQDRTTYRACLNDANQYLVGMRTAALQIERAQQDLFAAEYRLRAGIEEASITFSEGRVVVAEARESSVRPPSIDPWVDVRTRQYRDAFRRARRFVYLAARAVEYEYQLSSPLPAQALRAQTADELQSVLTDLRTTVMTGRVNGNAPSSLRVVLSLRQHLLALQSRSTLPESEQRLSDVERFRLVLRDPRFAVRDASGAVTGYQIPFSLAPVGTLGSRDPMGIPVLAGSDCAERVWSVNASVLGSAGQVLVGDGSTFTRLDLLKRNTFYSQWCAAPAAGAPRFQQASVRPSVNLFRDPEAGTLGTVGGTSVGLGAEAQLFARARMQPRINVARADFEDDRYANGETSELAGRGLYGDYALFIPASVLSNRGADGTRTPGLNLEAVDDVLLRFDYVSVAR